ncbi:hypothetical protein GW17_00014897 [Ensete ventricosum]|uniref:Uncharacterized protein n=1 Tax=Ensete ventricosum TaxID=4639 RepID=A0A426ZGX2_ENSVE|nr:hypothetical protein B296_00011884 [Ensete ventricosum]RWW20972.1 hypothetical protein GW17_00014897 [Ensete ventricosum]RZS13133.1 hypothetical protein BHM03_00044664 [Ensete ventricosum]
MGTRHDPKSSCGFILGVRVVSPTARGHDAMRRDAKAEMGFRNVAVLHNHPCGCPSHGAIQDIFPTLDP